MDVSFTGFTGFKLTPKKIGSIEFNINNIGSKHFDKYKEMGLFNMFPNKAENGHMEIQYLIKDKRASHDTIIINGKNVEANNLMEQDSVQKATSLIEDLSKWIQEQTNKQDLPDEIMGNIRWIKHNLETIAMINIKPPTNVDARLNRGILKNSLGDGFF
jgi:hypothetical protein